MHFRSNCSTLSNVGFPAVFAPSAKGSDTGVLCVSRVARAGMLTSTEGNEQGIVLVSRVTCAELRTRNFLDRGLSCSDTLYFLWDSADVSSDGSSFI